MWIIGLTMIKSFYYFNIPIKYCTQVRGRNNGQKDKDVIQLYGKHKCLCGWRNNESCKIGIPFLCNIKGNYIEYHLMMVVGYQELFNLV
jgi:C1A family cysteine protease